MPIPHSLPEFSPIAFGAAEFGTGVRMDQALRLVETYVAAGGNLLDTANVYGAWAADGVGASERVLGSVVRRLGIESQALVATKVGHPAFGDHYLKPAHFLSPEVLRRDLEESMERLGLDRVDLLYLHRDDGTTPVGEILDVIDQPRWGAWE